MDQTLSWEAMSAWMSVATYPDDLGVGDVVQTVSGFARVLRFRDESEEVLLAFQDGSRSWQSIWNVSTRMENQNA